MQFLLGVGKEKSQEAGGIAKILNAIAVSYDCIFYNL